MRAQFEPLVLDGRPYDVRVLGTPLEVVQLRSTLGAATRGSGAAGLAAIFLGDYEGVLEDWSEGIHSVAFHTRAHGSVCSCGLILGAAAPGAEAGHLDPRSWSPVDCVVVSSSPGGAGPFSVVCHVCGWDRPAPDAAAGRRVRDAHTCGAA